MKIEFFTRWIYIISEFKSDFIRYSNGFVID